MGKFLYFFHIIIFCIICGCRNANGYGNCKVGFFAVYGTCMHGYSFHCYYSLSGPYLTSVLPI